MAILIFLAILFILVLVHEWGHFIVAKKTGMRVDEFGIGFPPKLWSIKKGETEYSFNLFPIGGFVKIYGENAEVNEEGVNKISSSDTSRAFTSRPKLAQAVVLIAGVSMNVIFAFLLFVVALSVGVQTSVTEESASSNAELIITEVIPDTPAYKAGLPAGIVVKDLKFEDESIDSVVPSAFSGFINSYGTGDVTVVYTQGGVEYETIISPEQGLIETDTDRYAIGVVLVLTDVVGRPIYTAIYESALITVKSLRDITVGISSLLWNAVRLKADFSQVAGPVGIVSLVGEASSFGITSLLMFTAFISLNLAVINLFPFPALDGGRLLFVAIEAVTRKPINPKYVQILNSFGFLLLILLMVAVTWNDVARIL